MWKELILDLASDCTFNSPATDNDINAVVKMLGAKLPGDLEALLRESNGVFGEFGLGLIWNTERIAKDNSFFRSSSNFKTQYMPLIT